MPSSKFVNQGPPLEPPVRLQFTPMALENSGSVMVFPLQTSGATVTSGTW
jgi:hypothetical protein